MRFLYNLSIRAYSTGIRLAAFFNPKAKKWVQGRQNWQQSLKSAINSRPGKWIWFHCASLGEFEQGRPMLEKLKAQNPGVRILLTFFSPSGYEIRKNYSDADFVAYLPSDTPQNTSQFLEIVNPAAIFFIKYELWLNYLKEIKARNIPAYLVSASVSENSHFLNPVMKDLYKDGFSAFTKIFAQDEETKRVLFSHFSLQNIVVTGDTRFDRVIEIAEKGEAVQEAKNFCNEKFTVVCGSTWEDDDKHLIEAAKSMGHSIKWIVVPHEITKDQLKEWEHAFPGETVRFSQAQGKILSGFRILLIDKIGLLSRLYRHGNVAYIGGGFGKGIHNTLEAAVYGIPVLFGPHYEKFGEARELIKFGGGFSVKSSDEIGKLLKRFLEEPLTVKERGDKNMSYVANQTGASDRILKQLDPILI